MTGEEERRFSYESEAMKGIIWQEIETGDTRGKKLQLGRVIIEESKGCMRKYRNTEVEATCNNVFVTNTNSSGIYEPNNQPAVTKHIN